MEKTPENDPVVDRVRDELEAVEASDDEARLEALEKVRRDLESELDSSLENGSSGHRAR